MKKYLIITIALLGFAFFNAQAQMSILLVNDNGFDPERVEIIKTAITNSGYTYAYWDSPAELSGPSFEFMASFNLVIWYTGNDGGSLYFWNGDETENQDIKDYIDDGGMFWVQGLDFLYDMYPETPATFLAGEFVYDYLGIFHYAGQSHIDDGVWSDGVPQLDLVAGNGIFTIDPLLWTYDAMWYVDALEKIEDAQYIYQMGPSGYDLSEYYSAIYYEKGEGKVLSFAFETARIDTQDNTDLLFTEGLEYFEQFATPGILVEEITVSSEGGATTIEENYGVLQFYAEVFPENASIPFVSWSVDSDGVDASINQDGLLQASGNDNGNGTVWVKADAMDGSGIVDSMQVEISGQGTEFTVLLVNDNANGTDRYLVIDTSLNNLGYIYNIYNTIVTGDFPDFNTLNAYDAVIWYTGNDGLNLKLWDVSDTVPGAVNQNLKFNEPLMQYINGGGIVWLQGLDFIFDIYGGTFDEFVAGDFMYDFLGINVYLVQSHVDGDDLPQLDVVPGNPICSFTPVTWVFPEGLWYADGLIPTDEAELIYKMGPVSYEFSDYYSGLYTQPGDGHLFTLTVETARIDTRENTDAFFGEVLEYFESLIPDAVNEIQGVDFTAFQNSPNPVKDFTTFSWELKNTANVGLAIYDISGGKVFYKDFNKQSTGKHTFQFSARETGLSDGFYTYTLTVNNQLISQKMIINK
ncbi:MAG: T9SS type A sorting domain-containing protein [Bacteroidales bacterium]|nr:T9SS type A sorting domain-containing protein [Bacteroidales bacterium]